MPTVLPWMVFFNKSEMGKKKKKWGLESHTCPESFLISIFGNVAIRAGFLI